MWFLIDYVLNHMAGGGLVCCRGMVTTSSYLGGKSSARIIQIQIVKLI